MGANVLVRGGRGVRKVLATRSVRFAIGSGFGLIIDLGVFSALTLLGVAAFAANLVSSALAISTVYVLVTRFAFRVAPTWRTYSAFVIWYSFSTLTVSTVIRVVGDGSTQTELLVKLGAVPITFVTNFLFGRWLFSGGAERAIRSARRYFDGRASDSEISLLLSRRSAVRWRWRTAAVVVLAFVVLVLPLNLAASFQSPADRAGLVLSRLLQAAFVLALFAAVLFALRFAQAVRLGSRRHRSWLGIAAAYLAVNLIVLAFIYPGYWVWDEFYTVTVAKQFSVSAWQGYLTTIYYTFGMMLGPTPVVILVLQLVLIALIAGYVLSHLMQTLSRPWLAIVAALPLLSFPVLLNNQYPLRLTLYGYLLVLMVVRLRVILGDRRARGPQLGGFVSVCALVAILAFWRTEGLPLLLLVPAAFVVSGLHRAVVKAPGRAVAAIASGVVLIAASATITASTTVPGYQATAVLNPLSTMLQGKLVSPNLDRDLADINAVVDLEAVKRSPSWTETPSLWAGALRNGYTGSTGRLVPAVLDLIVHNPGPFLDNRVRALLAANSMQAGWLPQVQSQGVYRASSDVNGVLQQFETENLAAGPINAELKYTVEQRLLMWSADQQLLPASQIVWNALPPILLTVLLGLVALIRRRWWWAFGAAVMLSNALLVFLSEPAAYFMYFFPAYLLSMALIAGAAALAIDRLLARSAARRPVPETLRSGIMPVRPSILLAIPAYNCEKQISRVLARIDDDLLQRLDCVAVIDNRSADRTAEVAEAAGARLGSRFQVWRNVENFGLGGTHKVAFDHGLASGYDYVAVVHGDDQADPRELSRLIDRAAQVDAAAVLGARFIRGSKLVGYSRVRTWGNRAINAVFTAVSLRRTVDLGSGLNLFRMADLADRRYAEYDDGITFNIDLLLGYFSARSSLVYEPITWSEEDQVSNARNFAVGRDALLKLWRWRTGARRAATSVRSYAFEVIA